MEKDELKLFYGNLKEINPIEVLWQDPSEMNLKSVSTHKHMDMLKHIIENGVDDVSTYVYDTSAKGFLELYNKIKLNGFDSKYPIKIAIDQYGLPIVVDGLHRTCISILLGLERIPCEIVYRSIEWLKLKYALKRQNKGLSLYQPIEHFDLMGWKGWRKDCETRANIIANYIQSKNPNAKKGLELACNSGVVSCGLARKGYEIVGLDVDRNAIETAQALSNLKVIGGWNEQQQKSLASFETCGYTPNLQQYGQKDFVVCLSLLNHHQVDGRDELGKKIFKDLVDLAPIVIIDCPSIGEPVGGDSKYTNPNEVIAWCQSIPNIDGQGEIVAIKNNGTNLMRTLISWCRN